MSGSIKAPVTRTSEGEDLVNTLVISRDIVKIRYQIAPGTEAGLGIANADFKILSGGTEIKSGKTNADGEIEVPLQPLLTGAVTVNIFGTDFNLTLHKGLEVVTNRKGQQKRFDILGYATGYQRDPVANNVPDTGTDSARFQQAIMNLQTDSNLDIDGIIGVNTRNDLTSKAGE